MEKTAAGCLRISKINFLKAEKGRNINFQRFKKPINAGGFVHAMDGTRKIRHWAFRMLRPEGSGIGKMPRICAAAHGKGLSTLAGDLVKR